MEKKNSKAQHKTVSLGLKTETLRRLDDSQMKGVAGGARLWRPTGVADDTTPVGDDTTG